MSARTTRSTRATSQLPQPTASVSAARVTRSTRATKAPATTAATAVNAPKAAGSSGFLAKSKEGLRKVSDKIKEKEKEASIAAAPEATYTESLQAYLRIRPPPLDADANGGADPYLEPQNDKEVLMRPPPDASRPHLPPKQSHVYSFDRVFKPDTAQNDFFRVTTLPLVDKLLKGENALMFAYGVSNSGKTYTIQGGENLTLEERGVLPRSIDVVFNSIEGMESPANLKCQGLADVVLTDERDGYDLTRLTQGVEPRIDDSVKVDRNFSYAVFVSYAEVYNDKIFDLLDTVLPVARPNASRVSRMKSSFGVASVGLGSSMSLAATANGGGGVITRRALMLKNDPEGTGKYICGLNEIRVRTRDEALAVFRSGQSARQVFGTQANRESSRSHGIFTIKVVRIHNGAPEDPDSAQVSRLAIVDLAGSERTRNTGAAGDRLKEAGNINKSLMVLGQCLEVLRSNQQKVTAPPAGGVKRKLSMVPFRHSKLTEIFQNFFVGDGRAVMIVHVNPYDTGFDENSHVMRFSAIAREIQTTAQNKSSHSSFPTLKRQISNQFNAFKAAVTGHHGHKIKVAIPILPKVVESAPRANTLPRPSSRVGLNSATVGPAGRITRKNSSMAPPPLPPKAGTRASTRASTKPAARVTRAITPPEPEIPEVPETPEAPDEIQVIEEEIEVIEEDVEDDEDDERDVLVDYLFEQLNELKAQLYESEMRNAALEVEVREEVSRDMQKTIQKMSEDFNRRLLAQIAAGEERADRKLDILQATMPQYDTSMADTSMQDSSLSFTSAIDDTLGESDIDGAELSDPFAIEVKIPPIPRGGVSEGISMFEASFLSEGVAGDDDTETEGEDDDNEDDSDGDDSDDEEHRLAMREAARAHQQKSHPFIDDGAEESRVVEEAEAEEVDAEIEEAVEVDEDSQEIEDEDENEDEDEDEEDCEEEDDDDDDDEDEDEEEDESGSSFAESNVSATPVSSPEPVRKDRRSSAMPVKKTAGTSVSQSPSKVGAVASPSRAPLGERQQQDAMDVDDEDDDIVTEIKPKKKRTLGKRVTTEDEIEAAERTPVGGADVRRLVRGA